VHPLGSSLSHVLHEDDEEGEAEADALGALPLHEFVNANHMLGGLVLVVQQLAWQDAHAVHRIGAWRSQQDWEWWGLRDHWGDIFS
jgi:hypothetical protein